MWFVDVPKVYYCADISHLVVMFAKQLKQAVITFIMCACMSIFMKQFSSYWIDFDEILYWRLLLKSAYKIQVSLNLHKITGLTNIYLLLLLAGTQGMALRVEYSAVNVDGTD
jgi:drug/metabolite transporter (DMT)-like permease